MYAEILVGLKTNKIDKTFTYYVPPKFESKIKIGQTVTIPFMNRLLLGFVLSISNNKPSYEVKEIIDILDRPILNDELINLGKYMSKKTLTNLNICYDAMLPSALKSRKNKKILPKYESYLVIKNKVDNLKGKQLMIYSLIEKKKKVLKKECCLISISSVNTLIKNNIIEEIKEEKYRLSSNDIKKENFLPLTSEQEKVVNKVLENKKEFVPYLLHGVTGSGKTEVYMHIISEVLKDKKNVIVLVPEISLTPQMISSFKSRFGNDVAVLHSHLSDGEKYDEYRKIVRKEASIVLGARSAIFAPFENIGLIIIDEEHSTTYKQENNPKYNAIDIALKRCKTYSCPLILGSATPSIESYTRMKTGIYKLLELKNRINYTSSKCILVDMKKEIKNGYNVLSRILIDKINDRLSKNEQVIILLNRRGYNTSLVCKNCGETIKCPHCDIPLVYHKSSKNLRCHYCGYAKYIDKCLNCGCKDFNFFGIGTQKLEEEINKLFNARVIRMDIDTTTKKDSHQKIIKAFKDREYDILIGTQMIAKGLDFPYVTLVGVLNADALLNIPDFRNSERTFDLLNQVAGRAGRGTIPGEVIMQTFNNTHYSIVRATQNDYIGFYEEEMKIRKALKYPPFCNLSLIKIKGKNYDEVLNESNKIKEYLVNNLKEVKVLGPNPSLILKINNVYYMQIIIKYMKLDEIIDELKFILTKNNNKITIDIDLNPIKV